MIRPYGDRHGAPRPPREIEDAMVAAGATGDQVALLAAQARYHAWLSEQGYERPAVLPVGWMAEHEAKENDQ